MHLNEPLQEGWLSLFTLPVRISCETLAVGKSSCLGVLVVRGQEKPPSEVTWARYISQQTCTSHWTLMALVNSAVYRIAVYYNFNFHMKHLRKQWAEIPQVTPRILKRFPKTRSPSGFLLQSCTLHFLVSCGSDAPCTHRMLSCSLHRQFFLLLFFSVLSEFSSAPAEQRLECAVFVQVTWRGFVIEQWNLVGNCAPFSPLLPSLHPLFCKMCDTSSLVWLTSW